MNETKPELHLRNTATGEEIVVRPDDQGVFHIPSGHYESATVLPLTPLPVIRAQTTSGQCACATECEWLPEHYMLEHHPDCRATSVTLIAPVFATDDIERALDDSIKPLR